MTGPYHIAILDDNEDILNMATTMLQLESYRVTPCRDTATLLYTLEEDPPHVLLLDMLLSGQDGRELCAEIKNNTRTAHIPVIIFSAHPNAESSCKEAGADFFLPKPFEMETLFEYAKKARTLNPRI